MTNCNSSSVLEGPDCSQAACSSFSLHIKCRFVQNAHPVLRLPVFHTPDRICLNSSVTSYFWLPGKRSDFCFPTGSQNACPSLEISGCPVLYYVRGLLDGRGIVYHGYHPYRRWSSSVQLCSGILTTVSTVNSWRYSFGRVFPAWSPVVICLVMWATWLSTDWPTNSINN